MRGLTIYQPYASLLGHEVKQFETRGWATAYRGKLAIHAGVNKTSIKRINDFYKRGCLTETSMMAIEMICPINQMEKLPMGKIIAVGDLVNCIWTKTLEVSDMERRLGDFGAGRFAWQLQNVRMLPVPINFTGMQGLYGIPSHVRDEINAQLEGA